MLISFVIFIESPDFKGQIARIFKSIKALDYPARFIEVVVSAVAANPSRVYKVDGPPLIRIFPVSKNKAAAMNELIDKCHGHIIIVMDENAQFAKRPGLLKEIVAQEEKRRGMYIGRGYFSVGRQPFPADTACFKTAAIMQAILDGRVRIGPWGRLNRKEILRSVYRWDEITVWLEMVLTLWWVFGK